MANVKNPAAVGTFVYAQYRKQGDSSWTALSVQQATPGLPDVTFSVIILEGSTTYEYQVSLASNFAGASTMTFGTMMAAAAAVTEKVTGLGIVWDNNDAVLHWDALNDDALDSYSARYRLHTVPETLSYTTESNISSNSHRFRGLSHNTTYEFQVAGANELGLGPWSDPVRSTSPFLPDEGREDALFVKFDQDGDGIVEEQTERLLGFNGRYGGTGRAYLENLSPANGQVVLENSDGHYLLDEIRINTEIEIGMRLSDEEYTLLGGYISDVDEGVDPDTHLRTLLIQFRGLFWRLAQEDGLTAIVIRDPFDVLTSEAIERALAKNNRVSVPRREIDHGQVRMHNVNSPLIATTGLIADNLTKVVKSIALSEGPEQTSELYQKSTQMSIRIYAFIHIAYITA